MYGRAKVLTEIDGAQDRGACDLPRSSCKMDWSTCGWNGGAPPSNPSSRGLKYRPALLKFEVYHGSMSERM